MDKKNKSAGLLKGFLIFLLPLVMMMLVYQYTDVHPRHSYGNFIGDTAVEYDFNMNNTFTANIYKDGRVAESYRGEYKIKKSAGEIDISYLDTPPREYGLPFGTVSFKKGFDYVYIGDDLLILNPHFDRRTA